jgi:GT2 family glycosyltransferase
MIREVLGEEAARVAGRIAGDAPVLACELAFADSALAKALMLRRSGVHFALSLHVEDVRVRLIRERSAELCATYATWDEVRLMLDEFAKTIVEQRATVSDAARASLLEAVRLADAVVVRSWNEKQRVIGAIGKIRRDVDVVVNPDPAVPTVVGDERTDVVVYAPQDRADELAPYVVALNDFQLPVTIIARDAPTIPSRVRFVPPAEAARALGRARLIVDATANDPGVAVALAKLGRPLVVTSTGGANEILRGTRNCDEWNRRTILTAVANSLAGDPPTILAGRPDDRPRLRSQPSFEAGTPLVSVIVPTYNRAVLLAETLASIERQTYPALETIVVNDAGSDVNDVVARFSRARLLEQPQNRGPAAARNRGLADARGAFVMFFDDDDEMFPDHVAALANALIRTGLDVAYGQMIDCFTVKAGPDRYAIDSLAAHDVLLDHADIQWAGSLASTAIMFRRVLVERIGAVDESLPAAEDFEYWLRLAEGREWARVPDVTSMYFIRRDGTNRSANGARRYLEAHQAIYAKHATSRPLVQAGRYSMLELFGQTAIRKS